MKKELFQTKYLLVVLVVLVALGFTAVLLQGNQKQPDRPISIPTIDKPTPKDLSPDPTEDWKTYNSNSPFYKFSIMVPEGFYVNSCSTFSQDGYCDGGEYSGVYIRKSDFPYGLLIEQTSLSDEDAKITFKKDYEKAIASDIKFDVENVLMVFGIKKQEVSGQKMDITYTKYYIRDRDLLYRISIQTDEKKINYDLFKEILSTFKFTN